MFCLEALHNHLNIQYFSMLTEAAQIALEQKDSSALNFVLAQCNSSDRRLQEKINSMITSLRNAK